MGWAMVLAWFWALSGCGLGEGAAGDVLSVVDPLPDPVTFDRMTLEQLTAHGADLTKPIHVIHYTSFRSGRAARAAISSLPAGYSGTLVPQDAEFTMRVEQRIEPTLESIVHAREVVTAIVERQGGDYHGWEAALQR